MAIKDLDSIELSVLIFISQVIFLYLRTLNIRHVSEGRMLKALLSGNGIAIFWMLSIAIGVNALWEGDWTPIIAHLLGGSLGTYLAMKRKRTDQKWKKKS